MLAAKVEPRYQSLRRQLRNGLETTVHVVDHPPGTTLAIEHISGLGRIDHWAEQTGTEEVIIGGFFLRSQAVPLGELRINGEKIVSEPVIAPFDQVRACLAIADDGQVEIARRHQLSSVDNANLLQAGPLLVERGRAAIYSGCGDYEGFTATCEQFDSDIALGRNPRAALAVTEDGGLLAVACDGRQPGVEAGLTLAELADLLVDLGAEQALNLAGGSSTALLHHGQLVNRQVTMKGLQLSAPLPISTLLSFTQGKSSERS